MLCKPCERVSCKSKFLKKPWDSGHRGSFKRIFFSHVSLAAGILLQESRANAIRLKESLANAILLKERPANVIRLEECLANTILKKRSYESLAVAILSKESSFAMRA